MTPRQSPDSLLCLLQLPPGDFDTPMSDSHCSRLLDAYSHAGSRPEPGLGLDPGSRLQPLQEAWVLLGWWAGPGLHGVFFSWELKERPLGSPSAEPTSSGRPGHCQQPEAVQAVAGSRGGSQWKRWTWNHSLLPRPRRGICTAHLFPRDHTCLFPALKLIPPEIDRLSRGG